MCLKPHSVASPFLCEDREAEAGKGECRSSRPVDDSYGKAWASKGSPTGMTHAYFNHEFFEKGTRLDWA